MNNKHKYNANALLNLTHSEVYENMVLDEHGFALLSKLFEDLAGIKLNNTPKNLVLMASRLTRIMNSYKFIKYNELYDALKNGNSILQTEFISTMTTHTTHFFRENQHFQILCDHLPELIAYLPQNKSNELRIWSAACSTGEEVWSILIEILESKKLDLLKTNLKFLGTDIDVKALYKAIRAIYPKQSVAEIAAPLVHKYFARGTGKSEDFVKIKEQYKQMITFAEFNLQADTYPFKTGFDVIFCRNVFIYFEAERVLKILENFQQMLRPNGMLFVGHSEAIVGFKSKTMKKIAPAVYQKL